MIVIFVVYGLVGGYGYCILFDLLDLMVVFGDVVGFVGVNGVGKLMLLCLFVGVDEL